MTTPDLYNSAEMHSRGDCTFAFRRQMSAQVHLKLFCESSRPLLGSESDAEVRFLQEAAAEQVSRGV